MSKRDIIEGLLKDHDGFLGIGNMKMASRQVPLLIRALLDYVEEIDDRKAAPAKREEMDNLLATIREKNVAIPAALVVEEEATPCPPCDVTDANPEPEKRIDFDTALAELEKVEEEIVAEDIAVTEEDLDSKKTKSPKAKKEA